ncbi:RluA family pseudouridine synthase [Kingella kingae]|uniref:RluA family pseudouridine synthase n=1 Tax=Kingella kingae TaxID=504 RepID=UPI0003FCF8A9|nr:RluA family pseudouridine synthase [Kingella kingae]
MPKISKEIVNHITIEEHEAGQRLDNYLIKILKGVPKSHIHRIIRAGEVRVNKGRVKPDYRIENKDLGHVTAQLDTAEKTVSGSLKPVPAREFDIVFEDDAMIVINKPSCVAVHGGSGVSFGVIEQLRQSRPDAKYLELVHRLDRDTSGLLMIAKKRSALVKLHEMLRNDHPKKIYLALGVGTWQPENRHVKLPLIKYTGAAGEKMVNVGSAADGQSAHTIFRVLNTFSGSLMHSVGISALSLVEATLKTGRTHQIRVHMQSQNCPIAGDERYGDYQANKRLQKLGLKRMFLHAFVLELNHPLTGEKLHLKADLPKELQNLLDNLQAAFGLSGV